MKIHLINVGRQKFNGTIEARDDLHPDDVATLVYREAQKHLVSLDISVTVDLEKGEGNIFAGFHSVGKVKIEK